MRLPSAVRDREWSTLAGYALFVSLMTAGYYYDITFVQLGLIDLGTRLVGLPRDAVSGWMGALALATVVVAVAVGAIALVLGLELLSFVPIVGGLA